GTYARCVPGQQVACACVGGELGAQVCLRDSTFGPCLCPSEPHGVSSASGYSTAASTSSEGPGPGPGVGGSHAAGGTSGSGAAGGTSGSGAAGGGSSPGVEIDRGTSPLIDVFVADGGIFVVSERKVLLMDRKGQALNELDSPRDITAAAFDGSTLVI